MRNPTEVKQSENKEDILKSEFNKKPSISFLEKMKAEAAKDKSINTPSDSFLEKMKYPKVSADYADNKKDLTKEKGLSPEI
jgi:hypothetical protein